MRRKVRDGIADPRVEEIQDQIARWRRTRERRTRMPAALWARAVALAWRLGTYRIARTPRVDYQSLARRVAEAGGDGTGEARSGSFVELRGSDLIGGATVVEVADVDGARMTIRIGPLGGGNPARVYDPGCGRSDRDAGSRLPGRR